MLSIQKLSILDVKDLDLDLNACYVFGFCAFIIQNRFMRTNTYQTN